VGESGRRGGPLTAAAGEYDRAARELWGRVPPPSDAGQGLRTTAVLLTAARPGSSVATRISSWSPSRPSGPR